MIKLEALSRDFQVGDQVVHALRQLDLHIAAGEYLSIMGPSGSGKSTLLNILGLLDRPTSGRYWLNGKDVSALQRRRAWRCSGSAISVSCSSSFHLIPRMNALENVELPMILAGPESQPTGIEQAHEMLDGGGA